MAGAQKTNRFLSCSEKSEYMATGKTRLRQGEAEIEIKPLHTHLGPAPGCTPREKSVHPPMLTNVDLFTRMFC